MRRGDDRESLQPERHAIHVAKLALECNALAQQLMGEADVACYAAKDRGRNQVVVFDRREANRVEDHLALPTGQ